MNRSTVGACAKHTYDTLKSLPQRFENAGQPRVAQVLWGVRKPSVSKESALNLPLDCCDVTIESDKVLQLRACISNLKAIHAALMDASLIDEAEDYLNLAKQLDEALASTET